jgi:hypothetical protein
MKSEATRSEKSGACADDHTGFLAGVAARIPMPILYIQDTFAENSSVT